MTVGEVAAAIVACTGAAGLYLSHRLGLIGQKNDEQQQAAANRIQERITAFDELESLNDRLKVENDRLRDLLGEAETRGDVRVAVQARRCRAALEETTAALTSLQSVVVSEVARMTARDAKEQATKHLSNDHPDEQPDL